jgi:hypothetical protein
LPSINNTHSGQQELKVFQATHGSEHWCAAKKDCKNYNERANGIKCANCRTFTHKECFEKVTINKKQHTYCLWCTKIEYDRQMETSNLEEFGTDKTKGEEEIVFQQTATTPFESDTSVIRHEESFDVKDTSMNESYKENKLDYEKRINESTMIEGASLIILQELKSDLKNRLRLDINTRDSTYQGLAIVTRTKIGHEHLDKTKVLQYNGHISYG